jgi:ribonuclease E
VFYFYLGVAAIKVHQQIISDIIACQVTRALFVNNIFNINPIEIQVRDVKELDLHPAAALPAPNAPNAPPKEEAVAVPTVVSAVPVAEYTHIMDVADEAAADYSGRERTAYAKSAMAPPPPPPAPAPAPAPASAAPAKRQVTVLPSLNMTGGCLQGMAMQAGQQPQGTPDGCAFRPPPPPGRPPPPAAPPATAAVAPKIRKSKWDSQSKDWGAAARSGYEQSRAYSESKYSHFTNTTATVTATVTATIADTANSGSTQSSSSSSSSSSIVVSPSISATPAPPSAVSTAAPAPAPAGDDEELEEGEER